MEKESGKIRILVSGCLLGSACRYDGQSKPAEGIENLMKYCEIIPACPELLGGLPTPRPAAERRGAHVVTADGTDVTQQYRKGAEETLYLAKRFGCNVALLKEKSPSCGFGVIHNGLFDGGFTEGNGVTAELLRQNGVAVFGESQMEELVKSLQQNAF